MALSKSGNGSKVIPSSQPVLQAPRCFVVICIISLCSQKCKSLSDGTWDFAEPFTRVRILTECFFWLPITELCTGERVLSPAKRSFGIRTCFDTRATNQKVPKPLRTRFRDFFFYRGSRIRTHDLRFWRPLFYQLNYTPICNFTLLNYLTLFFSKCQAFFCTPIPVQARAPRFPLTSRLRRSVVGAFALQFPCRLALRASHSPRGFAARSWARSHSNSRAGSRSALPTHLAASPLGRGRVRTPIPVQARAPRFPLTSRLRRSVVGAFA